MIRRIAQWTLLAGVLAGVSGCHVYWGAEVEGWVVDAQTKEPLQGASVSAVWPIYGGVVHGSTIGNLLSQEVTTDAMGHFILPSWGPKVTIWNALRDGAPTLIVAKPNYYVQVAGDDNPERVARTFGWETRSCSCDKNTFALRRFDGNWPDYAENAQIAELNLHLNSSGSSFRCLWTGVPRLTAELVSRGSLLSQRGIRHSLPTEKRLGADPKCGDPKIVLRETQ